VPSLKISNFDGVVPRMSATMLAENQAQVADNVKLYSRELRYWKGPTLDYTPSTLSGTKTIYKHYVDPTASPAYYWLTWSEFVDVGLSPTTDTSDYRLYYTGDGAPKKTNAALIVAGSGDYPQTWLEMGVPAPLTAPGLTRVGGGAVVETRAYVYTYISTFGALTEESAPSPPATVGWGTGNSITVDTFAAVPSATTTSQLSASTGPPQVRTRPATSSSPRSPSPRRRTATRWTRLTWARQSAPSAGTLRLLRSRD
jgi:hypothetical protein